MQQAKSFSIPGIPNEELVSTAESLALAGATMPDGQKYEDWLKDKEGRKESDESRALP